MAAEGLGTSVWWGFSPALDLAGIYNDCIPSRCEKLKENGQSSEDSDPLNILLIGSGDLRHVLKTIAASSRLTNKRIHFYLLESSLECYARHLLFWLLLTEPPSSVGPHERTELFLEIFGNSLTRAQTEQYVKNASSELIRLVTNEDSLKERLPFIDLSKLKFKERDMMEGIFKFWRLDDPEHRWFDMQKMWDSRLRHHLGVRYDAKDGAFDWDYHMKLAEMASIVHAREYKEWRKTGVAFKLRGDAPYETPNRTLASGGIVSKGGEKVARRGYWGDIVNSPYISIGSECDLREMFEKKNNQHVKSSRDVAEYNILQFLKLAFPDAFPGDILGSQLGSGPVAGEKNDKLTAVEEEEEEEERVGKETMNGGVTTSKSKEKEVQKTGEEDTPLSPGLNVQISFLPLGPISHLASKVAYQNKFHLVYFSNSMVHHLNEHMKPLLREEQRTVVVAETAKYLLELKKDHVVEYCKKVTGMAKNVGFKLLDGEEESAQEKGHLVFAKM